MGKIMAKIRARKKYDTKKQNRKKVKMMKILSKTKMSIKVRI